MRRFRSVKSESGALGHFPPCVGRGINGILCPRSPRKGSDAIFENRELEIKENYNVNEIGEKFLAKRIRAHDGCLGIRRL